MQQRNQDFALGLTAVALFALLLGSFFFLNQAPLFKPDTYPLEVRFTLEEGMARLSEGSPVTLRGALDVGSVESVDVLHGDDERPGVPVLVVKAEVLEKITLYSDCRIATTAPVIGGGGQLTILSVGTPGAGPLPEAEYVNGLRPQSFEAAISDLSERVLGRGGIMDQIEHLLNPDDERSIVGKVLASLDDVNAITQSLREEMTPAQEQALLAKLHGILDNVNATTARLRAELDKQGDGTLLAQVDTTLGRIDASLADVQALVRENAPQVTRTVDSVASAARHLDEGVVQRVASELRRDDPGSLIAGVHRSLASVQSALEDAEAITDSGRRLLVLNRPAIERAIGNIKDASAALKAGIDEVRSQPWRILSPPGDAEKTRIMVFEAARLFAQAAARLDEVTARLDALVESAPEGELFTEDEDLEAIRAALRNAFENFEQAEAYLWDSMKRPPQ